MQYLSTRRLLGLTIGYATWMLQGLAWAQAPAAGGQPAGAAPAPALTGLQCVPSCRAGYVCASGACVSACNPPCASNESCTSDGQCIVTAPAPAPAPAAAPPPAAAPAAAVVYPQPPPVDPQSELATNKGARLHDGFYFRAGLGMAGLVGSSTFYVDDVSSGVDGEASGVAVASELAFGGSPMPGLVVGGGLYGASVPTTTYTLNGTDFEGDTSAYTLVAAFVDAYPNPRQGFHLQAGIGMSAVSLSSGGEAFDEDYAGIGWGLMGGVGYEGFVGDQWSLGGVARVLYVNASLDPASSSSTVSLDASAVIPGVLFTVTCH